MAEFNEFELIARYFSGHDTHADVRLGVGDDGAVIALPGGRQLVVALDTINEGVHFLAGSDPEDIGYKALAVNLSDLAAMGATPAWFTLAVSLAQVDAQWLEGFSRGLYAAASPFDMALIGGDTTRGPLSITVQVAGYIHTDQYLPRSGAREGDVVYVSGWLGDAALGLELLQAKRHGRGAARDHLVKRHCRPQARVEIGQQLVGVASACIDISDGLLADLGHICAASGVGAQVELETLPASSALCELIDVPEQRYPLMLGGGEDYELCLCIPQNRREQFETISARWDVPVTPVGRITQQQGIRIVDRHGQVHSFERQGYDHFASLSP